MSRCASFQSNPATVLHRKLGKFLDILRPRPDRQLVDACPTQKHASM
jgi:hypothetical protein